MLIACPHCALPAMPAWRKLALGPASQVPCRQCGLAIGLAVVPALVSFVPCAVLVVAVLAGWLREPTSMIVCALAALSLMSGLYLWSVPFVRRQLTQPAAVATARRALPRDGAIADRGR
jgi:hypothetical protein